MHTPHLDIVVVAPDGSFAATSGFTFDSNRIAQLEPVCTHPEQRRKGLAKAAILAGLQKVQALAGERTYVGTGGDAATNQFYADCGFLAYQRGTIWQKVFP